MRKIVVLMMLAAISSSALAYDLSDGAVMYMNYDEGAGQVTHDMVNGYDGMLYNQSYQSGEIGKWVDPGDQVWTTGKWGSAVSFWNGEYTHTGTGATIGGKVMDTHLTAEDAYSDPWGDGQDRSYSFWVRRPSDRHIGWASSWVNEWSMDASEGYTEGDESSVDWWDWNGGLEYDLMHTRYDEWDTGGNGRNLNTGFSGGGAWEKDNLGYALGTEWGSNEWVNIIMVVDGDPAGGETQRFELDVYVDGVLVSKLAESGWGWGHGRMEAFTIAAAQGLKGIDINDDIDDVGVWARLLTAEEIGDIAAGTLNLEQLGIPEPATIALLGVGAAALIRRKK